MNLRLPTLLVLFGLFYIEGAVAQLSVKTDIMRVVIWSKVLGAAESWKINQHYKVSYPAKLDLSSR